LLCNKKSNVPELLKLFIADALISQNAKPDQLAIALTHAKNNTFINNPELYTTLTEHADQVTQSSNL